MPLKIFVTLINRMTRSKNMMQNNNQINLKILVTLESKKLFDLRKGNYEILENETNTKLLLYHYSYH